MVMNIGKAIKTARNNKGLSQLNLALVIGNDSAYISRIENNQTEPTLRTIVKLAKALDMPPIELLEEILKDK